MTSQLAHEPAGAHSSRLMILGGAALVLLTLLAYLPAFGAEYIWDDDSYVTNNMLLRDLDGLFRIWWPGKTPQYYPIVFSSFWVEYQLWALNATGYHTVNILLHAANAVLLWLVMRRLNVPAAWVIGAVFALHPVHVESVAWIAERKNVLSLTFYLTAALAYFKFDALRFASTEAVATVKASVARNPVWGWYALALILFILALLSKSVTCSLPAALILALLWLRQPITPKRLLPLVPMFVVGFVLAMSTAVLERVHVGATGEDFDITLIERFLIAGRALLFYPWKLLWPSELMFIYPRWNIDSGSLVQYLPLLVLAVLGAALVLLYRSGRRGAFLALAFYAGTVFPAIGVFNVYPHLFSYVADHFVYHASIGILALVIGGGGYLVKQYHSQQRFALACIISAVMLLVLLMLTYRQAAVYQDAQTLYRDTIAKNPDAWMPRNNLASLLLGQADAARQAGRNDAARELAAEAKVHAEAALNVRPINHTSHSNRSEALRLLGEYEPALESINAAIEFAPHHAAYHWQRGRLYELLDEPEDAIASVADAVQRAPEESREQREYRRDLARLHVQQENLNEAATQYAAILETSPSNINALMSLAGIRNAQGRYAAALRLYNAAFEHAQTMDQQVQATSRLIRFLVNCPDPELRDDERAVALATMLADMSNRQDPVALAMLASVYHQTNQPEQAVRIGREAISVARMHNSVDFADQLNAQLQQYERAAAAGDNDSD